MLAFNFVSTKKVSILHMFCVKTMLLAAHHKLLVGLLFSCHLVIPVFIFRRSSSCGDFIGKSFPSLNE